MTYRITSRRGHVASAPVDSMSRGVRARSADELGRRETRRRRRDRRMLREIRLPSTTLSAHAEPARSESNDDTLALPAGRSAVPDRAWVQYCCAPAAAQADSSAAATPVAKMYEGGVSSAHQGANLAARTTLEVVCEVTQWSERLRGDREEVSE